MGRAWFRFNDGGGEIAAMRALLEKVDVSGQVLTLDALNITRETERVIVRTHAADYLLSDAGPPGYRDRRMP